MIKGIGREANPLDGDIITIQVTVDDGRVRGAWMPRNEQPWLSNEVCAIGSRAALALTRLVVGLTVEDATALDADDLVRAMGGFRAWPILRMDAQPMLQRDGRVFWASKLVSSDRGTELTFGLNDPDVGPSTPKVQELMPIDSLLLRDEKGREYRWLREQPFSSSCGIGGCRATVLMEQLASDVRAVTLKYRGRQGDWWLPIRVTPVPNSEVAGVGTQHAGCILAVIGAFRSAVVDAHCGALARATVELRGLKV